MVSFGDSVAKLVLDAFDSLPQWYKPRNRDAAHEWVPLSGIVLSHDDGTEMTCVALATGMQCLPESAVIHAGGNVLHDWHAEILAIRSFNHFLIQECHLLASSKSSQFVRWRAKEERTEANFQPFTLKEDLKIHLYCSEAPCGDASMELTMAAQKDPTPWEVSNPTPTECSETRGSGNTALHGRGYFSQLGVVRTKPSRPDAPRTLSKSCSDKLALKQCTSLISSLTSLIVSPQNAYLHSLVLPLSQYSDIACNRAFGPTGRLQALNGTQWMGGYTFRPFKTLTTQREFAHSRRSVSKPMPLVSSNIASLRTPYVKQSLIGGRLAGRKSSDARAASGVSRRSMFAAMAQVVALLGIPTIKGALVGGDNRTYEGVKAHEMLKWRRRVKSEAKSVALTSWERNVRDDFDVEALTSS